LLELALSREPAWRRTLIERRESFPKLFRFVDWFGIRARDVQRYRAAAAFRALGPHADASIPGLAAALSHEDAAIRYRALIALRGLGSEAAVTIPAVLACFHDNDQLVRDTAAYALGTMGGAAIRSVDAGMRDRDQEIRRLALSALDSMLTFDPRCFTKWRDTDVLGSLMAVLSEGDPASRRSAAGLIALIDPGGGRAVSALRRACNDVDQEVRFRAEMAMRSLGVSSKPLMVPAQTSVYLGSNGPQTNPSLSAPLFPEIPRLAIRFGRGEPGGPANVSQPFRSE
jgi:HEAT repeat protein